MGARNLADTFIRQVQMCTKWKVNENSQEQIRQSFIYAKDKLPEVYNKIEWALYTMGDKGSDTDSNTLFNIIYNDIAKIHLTYQTNPVNNTYDFTFLKFSKPESINDYFKSIYEMIIDTNALNKEYEDLSHQIENKLEIIDTNHLDISNCLCHILSSAINLNRYDDKINEQIKRDLNNHLLELKTLLKL